MTLSHTYAFCSYDKARPQTVLAVDVMHRLKDTCAHTSKVQGSNVRASIHKSKVQRHMSKLDGCTPDNSMSNMHAQVSKSSRLKRAMTTVSAAELTADPNVLLGNPIWEEAMEISLKYSNPYPK